MHVVWGWVFQPVDKDGFEIKDSKGGGSIAHSGNCSVERWSSILKVPLRLLIVGHFFFFSLSLPLGEDTYP